MLIQSKSMGLTGLVDSQTSETIQNKYQGNPSDLPCRIPTQSVESPTQISNPKGLHRTCQNHRMERNITYKVKISKKAIVNQLFPQHIAFLGIFKRPSELYFLNHDTTTSHCHQLGLSKFSLTRPHVERDHFHAPQLVVTIYDVVAYFIIQ